MTSRQLPVETRIIENKNCGRHEVHIRKIQQNIFIQMGQSQNHQPVQKPPQFYQPRFRANTENEIKLQNESSMDPFKHSKVSNLEEPTATVC